MAAQVASSSSSLSSLSLVVVGGKVVVVGGRVVVVGGRVVTLVVTLTQLMVVAQILKGSETAIVRWARAPQKRKI